MPVKKTKRPSSRRSSQQSPYDEPDYSKSIKSLRCPSDTAKLIKKSERSLSRRSGRSIGGGSSGTGKKSQASLDRNLQQLLADLKTKM